MSDLQTKAEKLQDLGLKILNAYAEALPEAISEVADHMGREVVITLSSKPGEDYVSINFQLGSKEATQ